MQHYWADNQVSATVTFKPEEAKDIPKILELYETRLKSISFLPLVDHDYPQAPYQTITMETFLQAVGKLSPLEFGAINTDEAQDMFCDGDKCEIQPPRELPATVEMEFDGNEAGEEAEAAPATATSEVNEPIPAK